MRLKFAFVMLLIFCNSAILDSAEQISDSTHLIPYFQNLTAINLLQNSENLSKVREYMEWYLAHLNYPDKYGLTGTIYDYMVIKNNYFSLDRYDSADSYASTFLMLSYLYFKKTGDHDFIRKNLEKLKDIAYLIVYLQDADGLVKACPNENTKYLVDNIENACGLKAFYLLLQQIGDKDFNYYYTAGKNIEDSIKEFVYKGKIAWAKADNQLFFANKKVIYPDLYAIAIYRSFSGKRVPEEWLKHFDYYQKTVIGIVKKRCKTIRIDERLN